jgi:hypothetical protein
MGLEELGTSKKHEGQPLINLIHVQEEPNSCETRGCCIQPLVRIVFPNDTRIESQQFILLNNQGCSGRSDS